MVGVALPGSYSWRRNSLLTMSLCFSIIPWLSSWLGSSSEQQMFNTLFNHFFERLVNKPSFENRIFVPSDGVAEGRLGYTTMTALLEDVSSR